MERKTGVKYRRRFSGADFRRQFLGCMSTPLLDTHDAQTGVVDS